MKIKNTSFTIIKNGFWKPFLLHDDKAALFTFHSFNSIFACKVINKYPEIFSNALLLWSQQRALNCC